MTNFTSKLAAIVCTIVVSTTCLVAAVGPAAVASTPAAVSAQTLA